MNAVSEWFTHALCVCVYIYAIHTYDCMLCDGSPAFPGVGDRLREGKSQGAQVGEGHEDMGKEGGNSRGRSPHALCTGSNKG